MDKNRKLPKTARWVSSVSKFAINAEQAQTKRNHPRMQQVHSALNILSEVAKDFAWVKDNDYDHSLKQALEALVHLTTIRTK